jgi:hypothetical protein
MVGVPSMFCLGDRCAQYTSGYVPFGALISYLGLRRGILLFHTGPYLENHYQPVPLVPLPSILQSMEGRDSAILRSTVVGRTDENEAFPGQIQKVQLCWPLCQDNGTSPIVEA